MGQSQIRIQVPIEALELAAIEGYRSHLVTKVSMPDLYIKDYEVWERMVKGLLRYPLSFPLKDRVDWSVVIRYDDIRGTAQHNLDCFVSDQMGWSAVSGYPRERLNTLDVEGFMEMFGVDRPTALIIKSVHHKRVILENEWIKVK